MIEVDDQNPGQHQDAGKSDQRPTHKERGLSRIIAKGILEFHPLLNLPVVVIHDDTGD
ncbi:hypothetical protein BN128_4335 [Cronobacter sakazakii 696]|nr:hypothetical protein BN129_4399 [Cronobacter sakazakii 701]CCK06016.1 hypothetical protein BN128_4335 [Cronobacter sakazakii 696]